MVMHWKTVSTANRMLSNWVIPSLGPIQVSLQSYFSGHFLTPHANATSDESTVSLSTQEQSTNVSVFYWEIKYSLICYPGEHGGVAHKPGVLYFCCPCTLTSMRTSLLGLIKHHNQADLVGESEHNWKNTFLFQLYVSWNFSGLYPNAVKTVCFKSHWATMQNNIM